MMRGGQKYIPLSNQGIQPEIGDSVNLDNVCIQVLGRNGDDDILRVRICSDIEKNKFDEKIWNACNGINDYKVYIKNFPKGIHVDEAKAILQKLEELMFLSCKTLEDCKHYKQEFPEGLLHRKADDLFFSLCKNYSDILGYQKYFPQGEHIQESKKLLDDFAFAKCKSKKEYRDYILKFPNGMHLPDAKLKIKRINYIVSALSVIITSILLYVYICNSTGEHLAIVKIIIAFAFLNVIIFYVIDSFLEHLTRQ